MAGTDESIELGQPPCFDILHVKIVIQKIEGSTVVEVDKA